MWKYVSRRVKDTLERSCQVLDVGRSSFCSSSSASVSTEEQPQQQQQQPQQRQQNQDASQLLPYNQHRTDSCLNWFVDRARFSSHGESGEEREKAGQERGEQRERLNCHGSIAQSWLSALTWSSAIVCGWYTSQYLCMCRKRRGWGASNCRCGRLCGCKNLLLNTTRSLHGNITSRIALAAPPCNSNNNQKNHFPEAAHFDRNSTIGHLLQNVNNNDSGSKESAGSGSSASSGNFRSRTRSDRSSSSLDSAVAEFSTTIGEIEFQFGVQELQAENYKTAVGHLKLATTHHHAGATFNLGLCYEKGLGVERDLQLAMQCYSVAASQGHAKAMYNLGVFYVRGWGGLRRSRRAARECFDSAARLGQPRAQLALDAERERKMRPRAEELSMETTQLLSATLKDVAFGVRAF